MRPRRPSPSVPQRAVLDAIAARKGQRTRAKDIAADLNISVTAAHRRIDRLQDKGLIHRRGLEATRKARPTVAAKLNGEAGA